MDNNRIFVICIGIFIIAIFAPITTLYLLEDQNIYDLNRIYLNKLKEGNNKVNNPIIDTIYVKYNGTNYNVSTFDEYQYSVLDKVIEGKHHRNKNLEKLKELEKIGLLKNDFFLFLASYKQIITRTNAFQSGTLSYSNKRLFIPKDNFETAFMSFEVENITGKIIGLKIPKEYIVNKKDILECYIDYLNLKSDDWIFKNNSITSKTKKVEIKIENINNLISISIVPYF